MQQNMIKLNNIEIPVLYDNNTIWYPITYLYEKVLLKQSPTMPNFRKHYGQYISQKNVDYTFTSNILNIQPTNCINKNGLIKVIKNMRIRNSTLQQLQRVNALRREVGLELINNQIFYDSQDIDIKKVIKKYSNYTKDCIITILQTNPDIKWSICKGCGNIYPYHKHFFNREPNNHLNRQLYLKALCRKCQMDKNNEYIFDYYIHPNTVLYKLCSCYKDIADDIYNMYTSHDIIKIHDLYKHTKNHQLLKLINNKQDIMYIIKYYYDNGTLNNGNICVKTISNLLKISEHKLHQIVSCKEIYDYILDNNYEYYPWHYPKIRFSIKNFSQCKLVINNYLKENNIIIENPLIFDYTSLIRKCKLASALFSKLLDFLVYYYNYQYAGYQFHFCSRNYYKVKRNRVYDLKFFINQDKKIPIDKIPLYLTKMTLQREARSLYYVLYQGNYYKNLYEWVNECYPNKFIEADFVINPYRNEFDSIEESQIHDILKANFSNIIYNQRNTDREINLNNMIPDWIILTNNHCILVEYFGLYINKQNNKRINDYVTRANEKINTYKQMKGYQFLFLYPQDLEHDFAGLKQKCKKLIKDEN